jgi:hypothetical protein
MEQLKPDRQKVKYYHIEVEHTAIDSSTFKEIQRTSSIELVVVEPLVDHDTITQVQHRRFGPDDGRCILFHSKPTHWKDGRDNICRIIATKHPSNQHELIALSLVYYDKFSESVTIKEMQSYMKLIHCSVQKSDILIISQVVEMISCQRKISKECLMKLINVSMSSIQNMVCCHI